MTDRPETPWRLRYDLIWAHALLWAAATQRGGEPKREVHLYLADRYERLSRHYERLGLALKAARFGRKASYHYHRGGVDDPPRAVAMAMPIPESPMHVDAIGQEGPDDVA